jgi:hypothetical protein
MLCLHLWCCALVAQLVVLAVLVFVSWALGWAESAFDARLDHNRTFPMLVPLPYPCTTILDDDDSVMPFDRLDMGFEMTTGLYEWLKANQG